MEKARRLCFLSLSLPSFLPRAWNLCSMIEFRKKACNGKWAGLGSAPTLKKLIMGPILKDPLCIPHHASPHYLLVYSSSTAPCWLFLICMSATCLVLYRLLHHPDGISLASLLVVLEAKHRQVFLFLSLCVSQNFMRGGFFLSVFCSCAHSHVYQSFLVLIFSFLLFLIGMSGPTWFYFILFTKRRRKKAHLTWATHRFSSVPSFEGNARASCTLRGFYTIALTSISLKLYSALIPAACPTQLCYDDLN